MEAKFKIQAITQLFFNCKITDIPTTVTFFTVNRFNTFEIILK